MARDRAGRPDNRPVNPGVVRQAQAEPRTIILPVVDGKGLRFTRLSADEGLSQTRVIQIVQDDQGFMWFGSQYGLNRYDGYTFKVFKHEPGRTSSLSGVFIYSLFKDRTGTLWVGCDEFLDKFDPVTETFTHYRIDTTGAQGETVPVTNIVNAGEKVIRFGRFRPEPVILRSRMPLKNESTRNLIRKTTTFNCATISPVGSRTYPA
jgi:hypothetical protein